MAKRQATEQRLFDECVSELPLQIRYAEAGLKRLKSISNFPDDATILDIGAAQGVFVAACQKLGYRGFGIEPWAEARDKAVRLSEYLHVPLNIIPGVAEKIPYEDETFDIVHANSVMEHVLDLDLALSEIYRVLKRGGIFWFSSASSMSPRQYEISGFPLFPWYPNGLKLKIMHWAKTYKPELIGFTETPAIHWFTPWKAQRILKKNGFRKVYDRWDMKGEHEVGTVYRLLLKVIRLNGITKAIADVLRPGCSYTAIK